VKRVVLPPGRSSNLAEVGHDPEAKILEVRFKSGAIYQYANVEVSAWKTLMKAKSMGAFHNKIFAKHPEVYPCKRMPDDPTAVAPVEVAK